MSASSISEKNPPDSFTTWARNASPPFQVALRQHIETSFHHRSQADDLIRFYQRIGGGA
jgi:hypothetical protein